MNLFQQRKNKRFSYTPRHLRDSQSNSEENFKAQWEVVRGRGKKRSSSFNKLVMLLIILGMIIAVWLILNYYEIS